MNSENDSPHLLSTLRNRFFSSLGWRVATLAFLALVLLIPLSMIKGLLRERTYRKAEAVNEIGQQWGGTQQVYGPFLRVPTSRTEERKEQVIQNGEMQSRIRKVEHRGHLVLLPESFRMEARLDPEIRYRGIFRSPVYSSTISMSGSWKLDSAQAYALGDTKLDWAKSLLVFRVSDAKGLTQVASVGPAEGKTPRPIFFGDNSEWVALDCPLEASEGPVDWELSFKLQGSSGFSFLPVGRDGSARFESTWPDPSFSGSRLPVSREISENGFSAEWRFGEFGRGFPQYWIEENGAPTMGDFMGSLCGVELVDPIDGYRLTERSLKYGSLFIVLGFAVFFLFEVLCGLKLHMMHYLLAGAAQAVFFLLVLALSEVLHFDYAYGIASLAATCLVAFYAASILGGGKRAMTVGGAMVSLYGAMLVILREQDYALLAGSGLLFVALAVFMFLTRKLKW